MYDFVIAAVPSLLPNLPPAGPAVVKSIITREGKTCKTFDLNIKMYRKNRPEFTDELEEYFKYDQRVNDFHNSFISYRNSKKSKLSTDCEIFYNNFINDCASELLRHNPNVIGLSLLTYNSFLFTYDLILALHAQKSYQEIILGGTGVSLEETNYGQFLKDLGYISHVFMGDANKSLSAYIQGETKNVIGIDNYSKSNFLTTEEINQLPIPNYDDYNLNDYFLNDRMVVIEGSQGCVRKCTFCDVEAIHPKYSFKKPENIVNEIESYYLKNDVRTFMFSDSLINGSSSNFDKLCELLIKSKKEGRLPKDIYISGQFICRKKSVAPYEVYEKMRKAGIKEVFIGFESGSDRVLKDMRKHSTMEDYIFCIDNCSKAGVRVRMLMLTGYPTETLEDHEKTIKMMRILKPYSDCGTITKVNLGLTCDILKGSPLDRDNKWQFDWDENGHWILRENPDNNMLERIRRRAELQKICEELGYFLSNKNQINYIYNTMKEILSNEARRKS